MNLPHVIPYPSLFLLPASVLVVLAASTAMVSGQVTAANPKGGRSASQSDLVVMTPFEVAVDPPGYQMLRTTTGTRLNTDLRDVPQSLSIVTKDLLDDTMALDLEEALTYVPNAQPRQNVADGVMVRGIQTTRKYYNNVLVPSFVSGMANIARVEILKGPASAIYGRGELGGVINQVSLQPSDERRQSIKLTAASSDSYEARIDATGAMPKFGSLSYRLTANYREANSYIDFARTQQHGIFPSLKWQATTKTTVVYDGIFFRGVTPGNEGTPYLTSFHDGSPPNMPEVFAPRSLNTSGSGGGNQWDRLYSNTQMHFASISHSFGSLLHVRWGGTTYERRRDIWKMAISNIMTRNPSTGAITLSRAPQRTDATNSGHTMQADVIARYNLLGGTILSARHETLAGYEYTDADSDTIRWPGSVGNLDVYAPNYNQVVTVRPIDLNNTGWNKTYGYYIHHVSRFWKDRLQFSVSKRWDDEKSGARNLLRNTSSGTNPRSTSAPRYGVAVRVVDWMTLYALRSEQEDPITNVSVWGGLPGGHPQADQRFTNQVTGTINEVGFKAELLKRRFSVTVAYFDMIRDGFIRGSNLTAAEYQQLGIPLGQAGVSRNLRVAGETAKGFEVEWVGQLLPRLSVFGGYGYLKVEGETRGMRLPSRGIPDYKLTSFVKYDLRDRSLRGFQLKGGVSALGAQYANQFTDIATRHKASQRFDAGAVYSWDRYTIDVLLKNVFNQLQVLNAVAPGSNTLGPERELWVSLSARW